MNSNLLRDQITQGELAISRAPQKIEIPIELIRSKKSSGAAFTLACDMSGLDDMEIYLALGIDAGYFSKIKKGTATLQADKLSEFCRAVGNRVYPEWLAYQIGCSLVEIETETQRQLRAEHERRIEAEKENELLRKLLTGKVA